MRLTRDVIERAADDPDIIWEYLLGLFDRQAADSNKADDHYFHALPQGLQIAYWVTVVIGEMENGGVRSVVWNRTNREVDQAIKALDALGAHETAEHIRQAVRTCSQDESGFGDDAALNAIDAEWDATDALGRNWDLLKAYIRQHPGEFLHG